MPTTETTRTAVVGGGSAQDGGFVLTRLEDAAAWSRKNSVWPLPLGLACCAIEFMATAASRYDMSRFGMEVARFSPRQADLLFVAGWLTYKMAHVMTRLYDQMAEPKWVVAMGACASSGGMHRSYSVVQGIDEFVPVDVYIPGCPPRPEAVLNALIHLQEKIAREPSRARRAAQAGAPPGLGGVRSVVGRGEMTPPALATAAERWVEGTKPRAGSDGGDLAPAADGEQDVTAAGLEEERRLLAAFGARWTRSRDTTGAPGPDVVAVVPRSAWRDAVAALKEHGGYDLLLDHTAVDYPDREPRFDVAAVLMRTRDAKQVVIETRLPEGVALASLTPLYRAADWAERETYDMFGIPFEGHRNLTRILMPVEYDGWPMRRDFPCEGHNRFRD